MWTLFIKRNNLTPISIVFVTKIDANINILSLTLDFGDFLSSLSNQGLKIRKMKFEAKIDFAFKFWKLKGPNIYNLESMRTKIRISPKFFKATYSFYVFLVWSPIFQFYNSTTNWLIIWSNRGQVKKTRKQKAL